MGYLESLPKGWVQYCTCGEYMKQSDPQGYSLRKTVVVFDNEFCPACIREQEIIEAQLILGRLGLPAKKFPQDHTAEGSS